MIESRMLKDPEAFSDEYRAKSPFEKGDIGGFELSGIFKKLDSRLHGNDEIQMFQQHSV